MEKRRRAPKARREAGVRSRYTVGGLSKMGHRITVGRKAMCRFYLARSTHTTKPSHVVPTRGADDGPPDICCTPGRIFTTPCAHK